MCTHKSKNLHEELRSTHIQAIKDFVREQCQDPFDIENVPDTLVNITSDQVASKEVEESMKGVCEDLLNQFIKEQLSKEKKKSFGIQYQRQLW